MGHGRHIVWLGLTPEPERELPARVALLRGVSATTETARVESLILHGTQRRWLDYLVEVGALAAAALDSDDPAHRSAALDAAETILDHHRMLIGLPGAAYARMAAERATLSRTISALRSRDV